MKTTRKRLVVKSNSPLARIAAFNLKCSSVALVLGQTIHVYGVSPVSFLNNRCWLAHELVHIQQYEKFGTIRFLYLYIWEWIKHGYRKNRYEIEAREGETHSDREALIEGYEFEIK